MLKLMLRRDDEFKGSKRAIDKPACGRQACPPAGKVAQP